MFQALNKYARTFVITTGKKVFILGFWSVVFNIRTPRPCLTPSTMSSSLPLYTPAWIVSGHQQQLITCLAISPVGTRLIVASEDDNLLLVNFDDGSVLGVLCFEHQFTVLAALWYSESNLIIGCSNGSLYDICFDPTNVRNSALLQFESKS